MIVDRQLPDEAATRELAGQLAQALPMPARDEPLILYLEGELGTGKTSLARGLLHAMGEQGPVRSPTYGLLSQYWLSVGLVMHLDLYRIQGSEELESLALRDMLSGSRLWIIEWPARGAGALPPPDLTVGLRVEGAGRLARLQSGTVTGNQWLGALIGSPAA